MRRSRTELSAALEKLRNSALKEMDSPWYGVRHAPEVKFDNIHEAREPLVDMDHPKDTAQYDGPNSPHIGNGRGAPM